MDYVIPGNDDAARAIELYTVGIADAIIEARLSAHLDADAAAAASSAANGAPTEIGEGEGAGAAGAPTADAGEAAEVRTEEGTDGAESESGLADERLADRIRQHVIIRHFVPARASGESTVTVRGR